MSGSLRAQVVEIAKLPTGTVERLILRENKDKLVGMDVVLEVGYVPVVSQTVPTGMAPP